MTHRLTINVDKSQYEILKEKMKVAGFTNKWLARKFTGFMLDMQEYLDEITGPGLNLDTEKKDD